MCDSWPVSGSSSVPSASRRERARASSSRAAFLRSGAASRAVSYAGSGSVAPCSARSAGRTNSSTPTSARDGVAREPEDERPSADAERERLSRPDGNAPEVLLDTELGQDPPDEVVRADRDPARADEHVRLEAVLERPPMLLLVVGDRADALDLGTGGLERRRQHRRVRLVDLPRPERLARARAAPFRC